MRHRRPSHARSSAFFATIMAAFAAAALCLGSASSQEAYPNKPVKIVVGMPAGSFTDLSARLIGDGLRQELKESFVVENRPGAATNIATQNVARSPKDGYTLLLSTNSNAMNVSLFKELPFDIVKDFTAGRDDRLERLHPGGDAVAAGVESQGVDRLRQEQSRTRLNFASTGSGTANHLAVEMLAKQAGHQGRDGLLQRLDGRHRRRDRPAAPMRCSRRRRSVMPQVAGRQAQGDRGDRLGAHRACARCADHGRSRACPATRW